MPDAEELHRYWRYLPTTVQVPNIRMYYEMRMARYEDPDYYNTADERQTSQRRAHFADDNQRPRYRSRSRHSPTPSRYDPSLRIPPESIHDRRVQKYQKPKWLGDEDLARRHAPQPTGQHQIPPPPGLQDTRAPPPRADSRPPLKAPIAQPIAKATHVPARAVRQHSVTPQTPNKTPRLESRESAENRERLQINPQGPDPPEVRRITEWEAAEAASSKHPPQRSTSRPHRTLLRPASHESTSSDDPNAPGLHSKQSIHDYETRRHRFRTERPIFLNKEWKRNTGNDYRLCQPGQLPQRAYREDAS